MKTYEVAEGTFRIEKEGPDDKTYIFDLIENKGGSWNLYFDEGWLCDNLAKNHNMSDIKESVENAIMCIIEENQG